MTAIATEFFYTPERDWEKEIILLFHLNDHRYWAQKDWRQIRSFLHSYLEISNVPPILQLLQYVGGLILEPMQHPPLHVHGPADHIYIP